MVDAHAFGIVSGTAAEPRIAYLKRSAEVTPAMMAELGDLDPTRVFRFSARCESSNCAQFADGRCGLGERIAAQLPPVVTALPSCQIRATCRWHEENGDSICFRCPQVVTVVPPELTSLARAATPPGLVPTAAGEAGLPAQ
ncbi:hypothetical protein GCM10009087_09800 [Sphingomonas oligophenolica]